MSQLWRFPETIPNSLFASDSDVHASPKTYSVSDGSVRSLFKERKGGAVLNLTLRISASTHPIRSRVPLKKTRESLCFTELAL